MNQADNNNNKKALPELISLEPYKARKDSCRVSVLDEYEILGYIAAGTYGKVYKAKKLINKETETSDDMQPFNEKRLQQESNDNDETATIDINNKDTKVQTKNDVQLDNSGNAGSN